MFLDVVQMFDQLIFVLTSAVAEYIVRAILNVLNFHVQLYFDCVLFPFRAVSLGFTKARKVANFAMGVGYSMIPNYFRSRIENFNRNQNIGILNSILENAMVFLKFIAFIYFWSLLYTI